MEAAAFELFGAGHLIALGLTVGVPLGLVRWARRGPKNRIALGWVILLLINKLFTLGFAWRAGNLSWQNGLPMHLCDWATMAVCVALVSRKQLSFELAYFWGLAGTLQALLTPDLAADFSDRGTWMFFISHSGVISAIIFLIGAFGLRVWPRSIARAFGWSQIYLLAALLVNLLFDANYGYLCAKPQQASLLDYLGPWPVYMISLECLALLFYALYYAPFFLADWAKSGRSTRRIGV